MTLDNYIQHLALRFDEAGLHFGHGTDNALDEAFYLVLAALKVDFDQAGEHLGRELDRAERQRLDRLAERRIKERVPVAYLVGRAWFAGLPFHVDERVLIPRSPIAELIGQHFEPLLPRPPRCILDLCTGSGCIGIACAVAFSGSEVDLADVSAPALSLARKNVALHGLERRVRVLESDLFASLSGAYDLIVCNPPYVAREDVEALPAEYQHEPELGLLSADEGLAMPMRILREAPDYLTDDGVLVMELGLGWRLLERRMPGMPFLWLDFSHGGEGVLALRREQILAGLRALPEA